MAVIARSVTEQGIEMAHRDVGIVTRETAVNPLHLCSEAEV